MVEPWAGLGGPLAPKALRCGGGAPPLPAPGQVRSFQPERSASPGRGRGVGERAEHVSVCGLPSGATVWPNERTAHPRSSADVP